MTSSLPRQQILQLVKKLLASTETENYLLFRSCSLLETFKKSLKIFPQKFQSNGGVMLPESKFFRAICAMCLCLTMTVFALGDTIRLKDGGIIKGKIVSFGGGKFTILIADGTRERQMAYNANEIESIEFDSETVPAQMVRTSNSKPLERNPPTISTNGNSTVITVGKNKPPTTKPATEPDEDEEIIEDTTEDETVAQTPRNTNVKIEPIRINAKVLADNTANGWTNSGWVVRKGQKIRISSSGRVSLGGGRYASPNGIATLPDTDKLLKSQPTGGLIAVIGDDNNEFIFVGQEREFIATRDGALFLGVNEGNLNDNTGAFDVTLEIDPTR